MSHQHQINDPEVEEAIRIIKGNTAQKRVAALLQDGLKDFIGRPNTKRMQEEAAQRARQIFAELHERGELPPGFTGARVEVDVVNDGMTIYFE